ncbi:MAG: ABC transporter substrate-binding protein [Phycisphaerales bacterium]
MPRVVSLLPSATESLCSIGGAGLLVGRSHECDYPQGIDHLPVLTRARITATDPAEIDQAVRSAGAAGGSLYELNLPLLRELRPDVILTQDLCEVCSIDLRTVERVTQELTPRPTVVSLNPHSFEGVLDDLLTVGRAVGLEAKALVCLAQLRERFYTAADFVTHFGLETTVAFLEWTEPIFIGGHWTPQLIERAGGHHPLNPTRALAVAGAAAGPVGASMATAGKSVRVPDDVLAASRPDVIIIAPCGVNLAEVPAHAERLTRHAWFRDLPAMRSGRTVLVDGNQMFNRPGPRLVDAYCFLVGLLNDRPEVIPADFPYLPLPAAGGPADKGPSA